MKQKNLSIRKYLTSQLFITWLLIVIAFLCFSYVYIIKNIMLESRADFSKRINVASAQIDSHLNSMVDKSNYIISNTKIAAGMTYDYSDDMSRMMEFYIYMNEITSSLGSLNTDFSQKVMIYTCNKTMAENEYITRIDNIKNEKIKRIIDNDAKDKLTWEFVVEDGVGYVMLFRNMYFTNEYLGCVEIRTPVERFGELVTMIQPADNEFVKYYDDENVYYRSSDQNDGNKIVVEDELLNGQFVSISCNNRYIFNQFAPYGFVFFIVMCAISLLAYKLINLFIKNTTKELYDFVENIGNGVDSTNMSTHSEIEAIKARFNEVLEERDQMVDNVVELEKKRKALEMEILQLQINPHLLYNSLSTVNWRLLKKGDREMSLLINLLTKYYRLSLSSGNIFIPIYREIELIEKYIYINNICKNLKIKLNVQASKDVMKYQVFKLMLQPIVENSILHGFENVPNPEISITVSELPESLEIIIKDNGVGIDDGTISMLGEEFNGCKGYGLKNSNNRIKLYYGDNYGIRILGEKGIGTTVIVSIGKILSDGNDSKEEL